MNLFFRFLKKLLLGILTLLIVLILLFLIFISILGSVGGSKDASEIPYVKELLYKKFELLEDCFLFEYSPGDYDIGVPSRLSGHSYLPATIDDYLNFPDTWETTPSFIQEHSKSNVMKLKVIGVLKKGTTVTVVKLIEHWDITQGHIWAYVKIDEGKYKDLVTRFSLILISKGQGYQIQDRWIKPIDGIKKEI